MAEISIDPFFAASAYAGRTLPSSSRSRAITKLLIFERVVALFLDQRRNVFVFQKEFVEPCDLRQHLQVGEVLRIKIFFRFLGRIAMLAEPLEQLPVARIPPNHIRVVGLKKILQGEVPLLLRQILGRLGRHVQKRILRRARNVILNLRDQRRHQIEVLVDVGKLIQQFHHAVIIFERMQAHPGQAIFAGHQILVERLVLMPEKNQTQGGHGWKVSLAWGFGCQGARKRSARFAQSPASSGAVTLPVH